MNLYQCPFERLMLLEPPKSPNEGLFGLMLKYFGIVETNDRDMSHALCDFGVLFTLLCSQTKTIASLSSSASCPKEEEALRRLTLYWRHWTKLVLTLRQTR